MHTVDGHDVEQIVAEMVRVLSPHNLLDWRVPAGSLDWSCWTTAVHVAHDLLAYAGQMAARPTTAYLPFDLTIATDASPREILQVVTACGGLLSSAVATVSPQTRAWQWGRCDPAGFAAMGVAETLLHTSDITQGWGMPWLPPAPLCAAVLSRPFPDTPPDEDSRRGAPSGTPAQPELRPSPTGKSICLDRVRSIHVLHGRLRKSPQANAWDQRRARRQMGTLR